MSDLFGLFKSEFDEESAELFAKAEEEFESGKIEKGLWSQALINAKGDEKLRKVEYMKLRALQLKRQPKKTVTVMNSFSLSSPNGEKIEAFNQEIDRKKNYNGIGRTAFILSSIGATFLIGFVSRLITGPGANSSPTGLILATFALFIFSWFRMKNIGKNPWFSLLVIVPFGNVVLLGWGAVLPEGYQESRELDLAGKIVGVVLLASAILLLLAMFL